MKRLALMLALSLFLAISVAADDGTVADGGRTQPPPCQVNCGSGFAPPAASGTALFALHIRLVIGNVLRVLRIG